MKLLNFYRKGKESEIALGYVLNDRCVDLTRAIVSGAITFPRSVTTIEDVLNTPDGIARLQAAIPTEGLPSADLMEYSVPLSEVHCAPPVLNPQKVIGIGFNYLDHAEETKTPLPKEPLFFAIFASAITGHLDPI